MGDQQDGRVDGGSDAPRDRAGTKGFANMELMLSVAREDARNLPGLTAMKEAWRRIEAERDTTDDDAAATPSDPVPAPTINCEEPAAEEEEAGGATSPASSPWGCVSPASRSSVEGAARPDPLELILMLRGSEERPLRNLELLREVCQSAAAQRAAGDAEDDDEDGLVVIEAAAAASRPTFIDMARRAAATATPLLNMLSGLRAAAATEPAAAGPYASLNLLLQAASGRPRGLSLLVGNVDEEAEEEEAPCAESAAAAQAIQCRYRAHLARRCAAERRQERDAAEEQRLSEENTMAAAAAIQRHYRTQIQRKKNNRAASRIQRAFRKKYLQTAILTAAAAGAGAGRGAEGQGDGEEDVAAVCIQRHYRAYRERVRLSQTNWSDYDRARPVGDDESNVAPENSNALAPQPSVEVSKAEGEEEDEERLAPGPAEPAALSVHSDDLEVSRNSEDAEHDAPSADTPELRGAVLAIQLAFRAMRARRRLRQRKESAIAAMADERGQAAEEYAAILLQAAVRGFIARRERRRAHEAEAEQALLQQQQPEEPAAKGSVSSAPQTEELPATPLQLEECAPPSSRDVSTIAAETPESGAIKLLKSLAQRETVGLGALVEAFAEPQTPDRVDYHTQVVTPPTAAAASAARRGTPPSTDGSEVSPSPLKLCRLKRYGRVSCLVPPQQHGGALLPQPFHHGSHAPERALPVGKRLTHVLLALLGAQQASWDIEQTPESISIDAGEAERTGVAVDEVYDKLNPYGCESPNGPHAREVYGSGVFETTRSQLVAQRDSAMLHTHYKGHTLARLLETLTRPEHAAWVACFRNIALRDLDSATTRHVLTRECSDLLAKAEGTRSGMEKRHALFQQRFSSGLAPTEGLLEQIKSDIEEADLARDELAEAMRVVNHAVPEAVLALIGGEDEYMQGLSFTGIAEGMVLSQDVAFMTDANYRLATPPLVHAVFASTVADSAPSAARLQNIYKLALAAAQQRGTRVACVEPLLPRSAVATQPQAQHTVLLHMHALADLLAEEDFGFERVYVASHDVPTDITRRAFSDRKSIATEVVVHALDSRQLALSLTPLCALLVPAEPVNIFRGTVGRRWATARGKGFRQEEEVVGSSTAVLLQAACNTVYSETLRHRMVVRKHPAVPAGAGAVGSAPRARRPLHAVESRLPAAARNNVNHVGSEPRGQSPARRAGAAAAAGQQTSAATAAAQQRMERAAAEAEQRRAFLEQMEERQAAAANPEVREAERAMRRQRDERIRERKERKARELQAQQAELQTRAEEAEHQRRERNRRHKEDEDARRRRQDEAKERVEREREGHRLLALAKAAEDEKRRHAAARELILAEREREERREKARVERLSKQQLEKEEEGKREKAEKERRREQQDKIRRYGTHTPTRVFFFFFRFFVIFVRDFLL